MRTIRENAGKLVLFSAMVIGITACSNVEIGTLAEQRKEQVKDTQTMLSSNQPLTKSAPVFYTQHVSETGTVENVGEEVSNTGGEVSDVATAPEVKKKKGMSNTAKGAIIGAGAGAITGAVVSKKRVKGAVIGGAIGAAVGAGVGAVIDKKKKDSAEQ